MVHLETISQYNDYYRQPTLHPLVTVIDLWKGGMQTRSRIYFGLYLIAFKQDRDPYTRLKYGVSYYDYEYGTLIFMAPGQVAQTEPLGESYLPMARVLAFHPDLIKGTLLGKSVSTCSFFSYQSNESLHVSEQERDIVLNCFSNIGAEIEQGNDAHSSKLIVSNIELMLGYCNRFYDRQFTTRETVNAGILGLFESKLNDYFSEDIAPKLGLPSVSYFARELNLSANYFGDLVKKATGKSAQELIHTKVIDVAKERTLDRTKSLSEVSEALGFRYPQHFTRFFKQRTGLTPNEYRSV